MADFVPLLLNVQHAHVLVAVGAEFAAPAD